VADFQLLEMVQATFYAMLLKEAFKLGMVRSFMAEKSKIGPGGSEVVKF